MVESCPYCEPKDPEEEIVFEWEHVLFTLNPRYQGALKHSGVIIPKAHRETLFDLNDRELADSFRLLADVKNWMDVNFHPSGYNIGWNCFPVGGQTVMHAHMHVIPRFQSEPLAGKGIRAMLKSDKNKW